MQSRPVNRRNFLAGSALAGAALGVDSAAAIAAPRPAAASKTAVPATDLHAETAPVEDSSGLTIERSGADFMVDVVKSLGIEYIAANPGSTFRGLQESFINYGGNTKPEWLTCLHEESSVAMAHGYYKVAGKPMMAMVHGTVGVQHAAMAIYNAYADRVPVVILSGNARDANTRRVPVEWIHSVQDNAAIVRDYTKWDDTPASLQHFAESQVRAMRVACAVPGAPVMITADMDLQEEALSAEHEAKLQVPKLTYDRPPQGEDGAVREAARLLVAAENPVIVADRYARTPVALPLLVELAELLQAPVIDTATRMNFPNTHYLNHSDNRELVPDADVILGLEVMDLWGLTHKLVDRIGKPWSSILREDCKVIAIGTGDLLIKANFQDFQRYSAADIAMSADPQATLPALIEAIRQVLPASRRSAVAARGARLKAAFAQGRREMEEAAALVWNLDPVHSARLAMEVWDQIKGMDYTLAGTSVATPATWARRLWDMNKAHNHTGGSGAAGVGYGLPAAVGAALANRGSERITVNFQPDGDFLYAPGALWTAAHHRIPLLTIMHNNRSYHQERMHLQLMANRHNRGIDRTGIGVDIDNPHIDFSQMAKSMGVYAEGPISQPGDLRDAIARALAVVRKGEPALLDVVCQAR
jgi:thiamine pyrophosphate-dependent acetolactate synthase large subunit-like protein